MLVRYLTHRFIDLVKYRTNIPTSAQQLPRNGPLDTLVPPSGSANPWVPSLDMTTPAAPATQVFCLRWVSGLVGENHQTWVSTILVFNKHKFMVHTAKEYKIDHQQWWFDTV